MKALADWQNFYVIVGSSAGALIGLQFVVLTLIAQLPGLRRTAAVSATFSTPTTVYFVSALVLAAIMTVPWHAPMELAVVLAIAGSGGVLYAAITIWRLRRQTQYMPVFEDWLFHGILPLTAYAVLVASGVFLFTGEMFGMHFAAAAALMLLLIGIHNAWDTVTYHVFVRKLESGKQDNGKGE